MNAADVGIPLQDLSARSSTDIQIRAAYARDIRFFHKRHPP